MPGCQFFQGPLSGGQLSGGQLCRGGAIVRGAIAPWVQLPGGVGAIAAWAIIEEAIVRGGGGGNCPGDNSPKTLLNEYNDMKQTVKNSKVIS